MQRIHLLDALPIWGVFAVTLVAVLLSVEGGYRLGKYRHARSAHEKESPVGSMVAATLGLLAFLLAFTFSLAASRFDSRKMVLLDEVNAIGTTYLRAGLLSDNHRDAVRDLLRQYVDSRLEAAYSRDLDSAVQRGEELQGELWNHAIAAGKEDPGSIVTGLFIQSLNETIDIHSKRLLIAVRSRIPGIVWVALYGIAILALGSMGYFSGLAGTSRSPAVLSVAFAFSSVMFLIADLDRPREGSLVISQQGMVHLRESMNESDP